MYAVIPVTICLDPTHSIQVNPRTYKSEVITYCLNNIDSNNTDLISAVVESKEKRSTRISYEEYFKKNLEIDLLKKIYPWQLLLLNGIFNLIVDTCSSDYRWIMIGGRKRPQVVVKSRFMKLNRTHIEYVLQCLSKNTEEIRDMRHYILVTLYNISTDTKPMIRSKKNNT